MKQENKEVSNVSDKKSYDNFMKGDLYFPHGTHKEPVSVEESATLISELLPVIRECYGYFSASNFTDRYNTADRLKSAITKAETYLNK